VQTSQGIGSPKQKSDYQWNVRSMVTARDFQPGETIYDMNEGVNIPDDYFETYDYYPTENNG